MSRINDPEAAMRLASTIAGDIRIYNQETISRGIREDNLFELLVEQLNEGLEHYSSRVDPQLLSTTNFFHRAIVDEILNKQAETESFIW